MYACSRRSGNNWRETNSPQLTPAAHTPTYWLRSKRHEHFPSPGKNSISIEREGCEWMNEWELWLSSIAAAESGGDDALLSLWHCRCGTELNNKRQRDFTNGSVMWLCCGRTPNFSITLNSADTSDTLASFVGQHIFALFSQRSNE